MHFEKKLVKKAAEVTELLEKIQNADVIGFDTESYGPRLRQIGSQHPKMVNVYKSTLVGCSFAFLDGTSYYLPVGHSPKTMNSRPAQVRKVLQAFCDSTALKVAHNWAHDLTALAMYDARYVPTNLWDTMVQAWLVWKPGRKKKKTSFGLKELMRTHFGRERPDFQETTRGRDVHKVKPVDLMDYACLDASDVLELKAFLDRFMDEGLHNAASQEIRFIRVVQHMQDTGMAIDLTQLALLHDEMDKEISAVLREWEARFPDVDIGSDAQVSDYFFGKRIWPRRGIKRNKDGRFSVDKETIEAALAHPLTPEEGRVGAALRQRFQIAAKIRNTYTRSLIENATQYPDYRLHPSILQTGTRTGRISMSYPNLMNIPVRTELGRRVREAFMPRPGFVFLSADQSQLELRMLAHRTGKGHLYESYQHGADVHQETADKLGVDRNTGKTSNFAPIYGSGLKKYAKVTGLPTNRAKKALADLDRLLALEKECMQRDIDFCREHGYVRLDGGRIRRIPTINSDDFWERSSAERIAGNTPIQGGAGDLMKAIQIAIDEYYRANGELGTRVFQVNQVHDELLLEVHEDIAEEAKRDLERFMVETVQLGVPLATEAYVLNRWEKR